MGSDALQRRNQIVIQFVKRKPSPIQIASCGATFVFIELAIIYVVKMVIGERHTPVDETPEERTIRVGCSAARNVTLSLTTLCVLTIFLFLEHIKNIKYKIRKTIGDERNTLLEMTVKSKKSASR